MTMMETFVTILHGDNLLKFRVTFTQPVLRSVWEEWKSCWCHLVSLYTQGLSIISKVGELFSSLAPQFVPEAPVHFLRGPCFNSGLSNYQWSTECIKYDFHIVFL